MLPEPTLNKIAAACPPHASMGCDVLGRRWEENHIFMTNFAYRALSQDSSDEAIGIMWFDWVPNLPI
ncbi:hypothetical protein V6N13_033388 [Hibiscus sabdariffa]